MPKEWDEPNDYWCEVCEGTHLWEESCPLIDWDALDEAREHSE